MKTIKRYGRAMVAGVMVAVIAAFVIWVAIVKAEPTDSYHMGWSLVRSAAEQDGETFAAVYDLTGVGTTNGEFASKSGDAFRIPSRNSRDGIGYAPGTNKWLFAICGKNYDDADDTFSFDMVGWAKGNGMMHVICEGSGVLGTQAVVIYPDGSDSLGELVDESSVTYTHATTKFTVTNEAFENVAAGMLARVTGSNLTNAIVQVTTATDANNIVCSGVSSTDNNTDSTVQINPAFWADTISLDEVTKWSGAVADANTANGYYQMAGNIAVLNSGDNEVSLLEVDLMGLEYIQFVFYDANATGGEAGDLRVYGRPF